MEAALAQINADYNNYAKQMEDNEDAAKEVADQLGISQSYISRLEKRIINRLKKEILRLS